MVTDSIAPVISEKGPATICTAEGMTCLSENLTWKKINQIKFFTTEPNKYIRIHLEGDSRAAIGRRTVFTSNAMLLTPNGWVKMSDFLIPKRESMPSRIVKVLKMRCLICQNPYIAGRGLVSVCGLECIRTAITTATPGFKRANRPNVEISALESWVNILKIQLIYLPAGIDCVDVTDIENGDSLYINNLLVSSVELQKKVAKSDKAG